MSVKIHGFEKVLANLKSIRNTIPTSALSVLRDGGEQIRKTAQQYAPLDQGPLEHSIKTHEKVAPGRATISIFVDENEATDKPGKNVGDYAMAMHESDYNLGPLSRQKQAALGVEVGRKFLERALKDNKAAILDELKKTIRREINGK